MDTSADCELMFSRSHKRAHAHTHTHTHTHTTGDFLAPDEVVFAVLLRGYGNASPPDWAKIDATLTTMQLKYGLVPATSELCCCWWDT